MKKILVFVFVLIGALVNAQSITWNIDSMKTLLGMQLSEAERCSTYIDIANALDENEPMEAMLYADSGLVIATRLKDTINIINGNIARGIALDNRGQYADALNCYTTALDLAQILKHDFLIAACYTNIGMLYSHQGGHPERVEEYFRKSMIIREKTRDYNLPSAYLNMSTIFSDSNHDSARYYIQKCIDALSDTSDPRLLSYAYNQMGYSYFNDTNYAKAIEYFDKGRVLKEKNNDRKGMVSAYANIGEAYSMLNDYEKAIENLNIALALANSLHHRVYLREIYFTLSGVYKKKGDYRNAYDMFQLHTLYRDSILEDQRKNELDDLEHKYEATQKERENELLRNTNDIQAESIRRKDLLNYWIVACLVLALGGGIYIYYAYRQKQKANQEISLQKTQLEMRNKEVFDSITYAKRIQYTLLANDELLAKELPEHFVYFKPKDIVSGDFYWATKADNDFYLASCDSTGHGVPGAFMSLLNTSFLNEAISEKGIRNPGDILDYVRKRLVNSVSKDGAQDGMDATLLRFSQGKITYAAANNNPVIVRNGKLLELGADKMPVGAGHAEPFATNEIEFSKGDTLFIFTDGYADQFGGPKGKKFKYRQLYDLLEANVNLPLNQLHKLLSESHEAWRGNLEQVDDICIIGFRC